MVLYEEVLQKNFEIIETFLNKFPLIFKSTSCLYVEQDFFEDSIKKLNESTFASICRICQAGARSGETQIVAAVDDKFTREKDCQFKGKCLKAE
jgi:hypothetical protein